MRLNQRHVQVYEGADGQWYWRQVAGNGEVVAASEGYSRKWNAKRGALSANPGLPVVVTDDGP